MPAKNTIKVYVKNGFYHIYNRGANKQKIFRNKKDYQVFLNDFKTALSPPPNLNDLKTSFTLKGETFKGIAKQPKNFYQQIDLVAYCLMPNHFHLLIKQKLKNTIQSFMRSLATRYSMYFNKKYARTGTLFQGVYKAVLVETDNHLLHLSRYIHQNPLKFWKKLLKDYPYSSYAEYLGIRNTTWIYPKEILSFFETGKKTKTVDFTSYESFVEQKDAIAQEVILGLTLD